MAVTETIGKVKLDLTNYSGSDLYTDGSIEDRMLELAKTGRDPEEIAREASDWAILYHFTPIRHNLLAWYDFGKSSTLLEIGAGCGAMTGLFCEKCKNVTAVELSKKRSLINANRNSDFDNLTIKVTNFKDLPFEETYDYVTLIGVFEYSIYYIDSKDPYREMLNRVKRYISPGGKLIMAIENKIGLKYLSGAMEDHNGRLFEGLEDYPRAENVRTFTKRGLEKLLSEAGFKSDFYYPYPDYKLPMQIFTDMRPPGPEDIMPVTPNYDRDRFLLFDESRAARFLSEDGYYGDFANSFLVVCEVDK